MLFSVSLAHKLGNKGLVSVSLHPGVIQTELGRDLSSNDFEELGTFHVDRAEDMLMRFQGQIDHNQGHRKMWGGFSWKSLAQGVATHVFAAFHPSLNSSGKH